MTAITYTAKLDLPPYRTWEPTNHYAWCRGGPGKLEWLGQMHRCRETGESRFKPLPIVEVDENGVPRKA